MCGRYRLDAGDRELEEVIRQHVKKVFLKYAQNLSRASAALKISRNTLRKYVQEC